MDNNSIKEYEKKKARLIKELSEYKKNGNISLNKETSNLFRHRIQENQKKIDVSDFNNVISIDIRNLTAEVEGMITYEDLVSETLKYGLIPLVVPQLKSITVGGAVTGGGIESSSFRYGFSHETITEIEVLLSNGRTILCNRKKNKDLFFGFPNSYGTLGYAIKLKLKLIPVKKYVRIKHKEYSNLEKYFNDIEKFCSEKNIDFIDGTVFSRNKSYITIGAFTDKAPFLSNYKHMKIYYKSIKKKKIDYLTTQDYLWRWDTDWFWCSKHFFVQNPVSRFILGEKRLNSKTYWKIMKQHKNYPLLVRLLNLRGIKESVIQDVQIPIKNCSKFIDFLMEKIKIFPIWICPAKAYDKTISFDLYPTNPNILYLNFGFWDTIISKKEKGFFNKLIERKVEELSGKKSLYSDSYYTRKKFWEIFNESSYKRLKKKYDPDNKFLDLYEKCVLKR